MLWCWDLLFFFCTTRSGSVLTITAPHTVAFWDFFCQQQGDSVERGKRIRFLAHSNLFLIADWETLYGCGKFLSDSKPLEFQTVAWGLETHKVNLDFCSINESDCFLGRLWVDHEAACCACHQMGEITLITQAHRQQVRSMDAWRDKAAINGFDSNQHCGEVFVKAWAFLGFKNKTKHGNRTGAEMKKCIYLVKI